MTASAKVRAMVEPVRADETPWAMRSAVEARGIRHQPAHDRRHPPG